MFRHLVELIWASDQPVAKASYIRKKTQLRKTRTNIMHSNPRSQHRTDQGIRLRQRGHWDR
jgi:hypothetical protein